MCGYGRIGGRTCGALYDALTSRARTITSLKPYTLHDGGSMDPGELPDRLGAIA